MHNRYRLERKLGAGGMATVYLAHDLKHDRQVALKVLRSDLSSELSGGRFAREIRLAAKLTHPHILPLFDSGEADGFLYYVMPLMEGQSLRDRLEKTRQMAVDEAIQIAREVADALDYAHRHDTVHRDIKPENIMLHEGHAVVADFGIAKAVTAAAETQESITRTGVTVGTPAYMSPEQGTGEEQLDGRSDLFSLGCVLYEMLTGEPAFAAKSAAATIAKRFSYTPPPVTETRDAVPIHVSQAIAQLLERDPENRPASGATLIELLTSGAGAAAPPPSVHAKSVAVLPFANLSPDPENEYFADGVTEEIINALARLEGLQVASRTSCFYFKGKHPPLKEVSRELKVATVLTGGVRRAGSRIRITAELVDVASDEHLWSDRYDRQLDDIFEVQDEISRAIAEALQVALGGRAGQRLVEKGTTNLEAYELYLKGRYLWSQRGHAMFKGLDCFKQALALDPNYALAHAGLADSFSLLAFYGLTRPGEAIRQSVVAAKRALELNPALGEAHVSLAFHDMCYRWDWDAAEREYSRALELNPHYTPAWYWRAALYGFFKWVSGADAGPAFSDVQHAIQIDPLAWHPRLIHGWILMFHREFDQAAAVFRHVLDLHPNLFVGHLLLAGTLRHAGNLDEAITAGQAVLESSGRNLWTVVELALSYAAAGRKDDARALYREMLARSQQEYVQGSVLAPLSAELGDMDAAIAQLEAAYAEHDLRLCYIGGYPDYDVLRGEPRFADLLGRLGFPAESPARLKEIASQQRSRANGAASHG